jgi:hypothetical protein
MSRLLARRASCTASGIGDDPVGVKYLPGERAASRSRETPMKMTLMKFTAVLVNSSTRDYISATLHRLHRCL